MNPQGTDILIVDDEADFLAMVTRMVEGFGYKCTSTTDPAEAAQLVTKYRFDVLLTDSRMPELNGERLINIARKDSPDTVCIVMSGYTDPDVIVRTMREHGAYDFLFKPFERRVLQDTLARAREMIMARRKERLLLESERHFHEDALRTFDWKREIREKHVESMSTNLIRQLNNSFFQGGGIGSLISVLNMAIPQFKHIPDQKVYEVNEDMAQLVFENFKLAAAKIEGIKKAQQILDHGTVNSNHETMPTKLLREYLDELRQEVEPMLELKGQKLILSAAPDASEKHTIPFNRDLMRSVFLELWINAMKYSREQDTIFTLFFVRGELLEIKVTNPAYMGEQGQIGIQDRDAILVFEPFYRLSSLVDDRYSMEEFDSGLGLAMVKRILESHGGDIYAHTIKNHMGNTQESDVCMTLLLKMSKDD